MARLKVYRTPAGFYDAFVAASSQKAALKAWGSDVDLFARGIAETITDPALSKEPLARPGEVIKVARTAGDAAPEPKRAASKAKARKSAPPTRRKPQPRPSRDALDNAEQAIADAEAEDKAARDALRREEEALTQRRRELDQARATEAEKLEQARIDARDAYDAALKAWRRENAED